MTNGDTNGKIGITRLSVPFVLVMTLVAFVVGVAVPLAQQGGKMATVLASNSGRINDLEEAVDDCKEDAQEVETRTKVMQVQMTNTLTVVREIKDLLKDMQKTQVKMSEDLMDHKVASGT